MKHRTLGLAFATFSYGGNGGIASESPHVGRWLIKTIMEADRDDRISDVWEFDIVDTPITMTRNDAVCRAREIGADVLVMVDSDMKPDCELGSEDTAKPFFQTSFDFLYDHWDTGPSVICSPYCGPPPIENVYVFRWANYQTDNPNPEFHLEQYEREEAAQLGGIQEVAAQPTGLIMFDMRAFELTEPKTDDDKPWFYYEYTDKYQRNKCSTEDVTATRDISLQGQLVLGYNPMYCNWDAWSSHLKYKEVRKPRVIRVEDVSKKLADAVQNGQHRGEQLTYFRGAV